eukprot:Skav210543  [mRNA]  locus=scaffold3117:25117:28209:- [translate_table: standard]
MATPRLADLGFVAVLPSYRLTWIVQEEPALRSLVAGHDGSYGTDRDLNGNGNVVLELLDARGEACPGVRHPSHLEDCALALSWVRSGATRDPQKLVLLGNSAGAHLAAMLLLEPSHRASTAAPGCPAQVRGADCPGDMVDSWGHPHLPAVLPEMF